MERDKDNPTSSGVGDFQGKVDGGGVKFDERDGKNRLDLIPPQIIEALGQVYTYGAAKYAENNWMRGLKQSRVFGAVERHILADRQGENYDPESKLLHLAHAFWGIGTLLYYRLRGEQYKDFDDRVFRESLATTTFAWSFPVSVKSPTAFVDVGAGITDSKQVQGRNYCARCNLWYNELQTHVCIIL